MVPPELGLLLMSMRSERDRIAICRMAGLYSVDSSFTMHSEYVHCERQGLGKVIVESIYASN